MRRLQILWVVALMWLPTAAVAETYLLMAEEDGCYWCAKWNEEIAHIYPKTTEGKLAPLQRYALHSETPDVTFDKRVHFTPTFVLVQDGAEVGRSDPNMCAEDLEKRMR